MHFKYICVFLICALQVDIILGLKCYACVQSGMSGDRKCEKDPKGVQNGAINCNKKYCVIRRVEYVDQPGSIFSFYRGCEQKPDFINSEITDSQFKTYYRACTTGLCNDGDGRSGSGGGGGGISSDGDGDVGAILVPGIGGGASTLTFSVGLISLAFIWLIRILVL